MNQKKIAKDLKQGDVISLGGHYGHGDDIVKSVIKCPEGVIIYTERGGEFSVSENTTFDFVGTERRCVMSERTREFWRVLYECTYIFNGESEVHWIGPYHYDETTEAWRDAKIQLLQAKEKTGDVRNIRVQRICETIMSEETIGGDK